MRPSLKKGLCLLPILERHPSSRQAPLDPKQRPSGTLTTRPLWCHQHLLGDVEDSFVQVEHRPHRGYSGYSMLYMLTHLYETYTDISNANWLANNKHFREAYAPTNPIEVVWRQIDDAVA